MNFELLTTASQELFQQAARIAQERHNPVLLPLHLLTASFENNFCLVLYQSLNINVEKLYQIVHDELEKLPETTLAEQDNKTIQQSEATSRYKNEVNNEVRVLTRKLVKPEWITNLLGK